MVLAARRVIGGSGERIARSWCERRKAVSKFGKNRVFQQEGQVAGSGLGSRRRVEAVLNAANSLIGPPQCERVWDAGARESQQVGSLPSEERAGQTVGSADGRCADGWVGLSDEVGEDLDDGVGDGDSVCVGARLGAFGDLSVAQQVGFAAPENKPVRDAEQGSDVAPYLDEALARVFVERDAEEMDVLQQAG